MLVQQDFQRLHQAEQLAQACCGMHHGKEQLPAWIRPYASAAWQDRSFAEQNFMPLQQARMLLIPCLQECMKDEILVAAC